MKKIITGILIAIPILADIFSILGITILGLIDKNSENYMIVFPILWTAVIFFTSIIVIIYIYRSKEKQTSEAIANIIKDTCAEVHKYTHNVRDIICSDVTSISYFNIACQTICNIIEKAFNSLWQHKYVVSVCVKRIINSENEDFKKWKLQTIARSSSTVTERSNNDIEAMPTVEDNSDFFIILSPNYKDTAFLCSDLTKITDEFKETYKIDYKNSTYNYVEYYQSTIVVPIRIAIEKANIRIRNTIKDRTYHVVGFICIDTTEKFTGNRMLFKAGGELAKAFADCVYKLFEDNIICSMQTN